MLPVSYHVDVNTFSQTISNRYLMNSYKLYWFAGILEEVKSGNNKISFKRIVSRMVARSWYSLLKYKLHFGFQDRLYVLVQYVQQISCLEDTTSESAILQFIENSNDRMLDRYIRHFYTFVPYRFISPFYYDEIKGIQEKDKNVLLGQLSKSKTKFYCIEDERIELIEEWFDYLYTNQTIIEGWLNLRLITFLQRRNPHVPAISAKLYPPRRRNLKNATRFWAVVQKEIGIYNIYTGDNIKDNDYSLDHFIPWSFVMHDSLWNLIPVSRSINSMKSDRIPKLSKYLENFCDIQYSAFNTALNIGLSKKNIEDYLFLSAVELKKDFPKEIFVKSLHEIIKPLHQLAMNQGFQVWENHY
ncbi:MAG: HNH endonuclease domain-containing protein [Candidatus Tenebribacter davisii]|nr:HNH endonuclease domain-containing protein [Candidatus Tenebribacter davisii]